MKLKIKEFRIYIDEAIIITAIFCVIFQELRGYFENYFICYLFIIFHEFAHVCIASIFGIKTTSLSIRLCGLNISLNERKRHGMKWVAIFLAGPLANIILAIVFKNIPLVFSINIALATINLIPIYPLDGYNIFKILLQVLKVKENNAKKIQITAEVMVIIVLVILGIYELVIFNNLSIFLMFFYIFIQASSLRKNWRSGMYQKYYKNITNFQKNY